MTYFLSVFKRKTGWKLVLLLICIVSSSIAGVYPVKLIQQIVDYATEFQNDTLYLILRTGFLYLMIQVCGAGLNAGVIALTNDIQAEIAFYSQIQLYNSMIQAPISVIKKKDWIDFNGTLTKDTENISQNILQPYVSAVSSTCSFLFGLYYMLSINVILTVIILPLGVISSLIIRRVNLKSEKNWNEQRDLLKDLWKVFHEGIYGILPIKLHYYADRYLEKIYANGKKLRRVQEKQGRLEGVAFFFTKALFMSTIGIILVLASILVTKNLITVGGLTAILMYNHMLTDPLLELLKINQSIIKVNVSVKRVRGIMDLPKEETNVPYEHVDEIQVQNLSKTIAETENEVFRDISFQILPNSSFGIFGETGVGKSTLVNVISGIDQPDSGKVYYLNHGQLVQGKPRISYMVQDEYLFDATIFENIQIANPKITNEEYQKLIKICELEQVCDLHKGAIGENGSKLSGGERKRVLIARTVADFNADIYIFDEMSTSLDLDTFYRIFEKIEEELRLKIRIYIDHNQQIKKKIENYIFIEEAKDKENYGL